MMRPTPEVIDHIANIGCRYPDFIKWLEDWRRYELENLPSITNNLGIAQGRCQVLKELYRLFTQAPEMADPKRKPKTTAHR